MPTTRFSIMSIRPTPREPASPFRAAMSSASGSSSPSSETGRPSSKPMTTSSGSAAPDGRDGQHERRLGGRRPRVLQHPGLDRAPEQVVVDRERRLRLRLDRDPALGGVGDLGVARPRRVPQRGDHAHAGVRGLERQLEAHLVVALAGAAVHDRVRAELAGDLADRLADDRPRRATRSAGTCPRRARWRATPSRRPPRRTGPCGRADDVVGAGRVAALDGRLEVGLLATSTSTAITSSKP